PFSGVVIGKTLCFFRDNLEVIFWPVFGVHKEFMNFSRTRNRSRDGGKTAVFRKRTASLFGIIHQSG
ncbi:MAG: hypothetical protein IJG53_07700, partial [Eggerthellaceae bacterium]|nr:hypothetical protein [Eggerthellaceae bacterium]